MALSAAGCSTQSVSERSAACRVGDWHAYGVADGRLGVPAEDRQDFFTDCRELGLTVDEAAYRTGRAEGLMYYCTAESGYQAGREGRPYHQVCHGQGDVAFRQGYERGREERPASARIRPSFGLGIGSDHSWGGVGIGVGVPFYHGGHGFHGRRRGFPGFHDYCFYNSAYCRARGWW